MAKMYIVRIRTSDKDIPTILSVLSGSATLVDVKEEEEPEAKPDKRAGRKVQFSYVGGKHNKGIKGDDLALNILKSAPRAFTSTEVAEEFAANNFSPASALSTLSKLTLENKIQRVGVGQYQSLPVSGK